MKQIEITARVNETLDNVLEKLKQQGFEKIRESRVEDKYLTQKYNELNQNNILDILKTCILLRYLKVGNEEFKKITYKNKVYDNNEVITEEKINLNCDDLNKAKKLFECLQFKEIISVNYDVLVMKKDNLELAFQNVENLGLLVEYEATDDYNNISSEEIKNQKNKMFNQIKDLGLDIYDYDVKKAYELIKKTYQN